MVNVPREGEFEADMVLYWQQRARKAEAEIKEYDIKLDTAHEVILIQEKEMEDFIAAISKLPDKWRKNWDQGGEYYCDELEATLNRSKP